ncbi:MAG: hypothetical protein JWN43_1920 [Gammaproteobacteria bacterium]|nr:hypothetical protein [Gammaproteobacteria bacterium]
MTRATLGQRTFRAVADVVTWVMIGLIEMKDVNHVPLPAVGGLGNTENGK